MDICCDTQDWIVILMPLARLMGKYRPGLAGGGMREGARVFCKVYMSDIIGGDLAEWCVRSRTEKSEA